MRINKLHSEDKVVFKNKESKGQMAKQNVVHGNSTAILWEY